MDLLSQKKILPVKKTSLHYQPLYPPLDTQYCGILPVHHTGAKPDFKQFQQGIGHAGYHLGQSEKEEDRHAFQYLKSFIEKMSVTNQIWKNTFPINQWKTIPHFMKTTANFLIFSTCFTLFILQILYHQDLKLCRDFNSKLKPYTLKTPTTGNSTLNEVPRCSFLDNEKCQLASPLATGWRLQEYAWLRVLLSSIQYIPFLFLMVLDWYTIRTTFLEFDQKTNHYKLIPEITDENGNVTQEAEDPEFDDADQSAYFLGWDVNQYISIFTMLFIFCSFLVGIFVNIIDFQAMTTAKDCKYSNQETPTDWSFFFPTQTTPHELPTVFFVFGLLHTMWTVLFIAGKISKINQKTKEKQKQMRSDRRQGIKDRHHNKLNKQLEILRAQT